MERSFVYRRRYFKFVSGVTCVPPCAPKVSKFALAAVECARRVCPGCSNGDFDRSIAGDYAYTVVANALE